MSVYRNLVFPILRLWDAESAHDLTLSFLALAQKRALGRALIRLLAGSIPADPVKAFGLTFPNILGVAAGFDKDGRVAPGLALLGFGHIEVGTVTPSPQEGNARPRIFRLPGAGALINRMGFPSAGSKIVAANLDLWTKKRRSYLLGASIGKQKETPLHRAASDYRLVMRTVFLGCDYLAVNISSPNTPGLRDLQTQAYLEELLTSIMSEVRALSNEYNLAHKPVLLKIAPDLTWKQLDGILQAAEDHGVSGIIATNTTVDHEGIRHSGKLEQGGLSGRPLSKRCNEMIAYIVQNSAGRLPVIGVGGVFSVDDVKAKVDVGATLVQVYTGLIYEGPGMAGRILRGL